MSLIPQKTLATAFVVSTIIASSLMAMPSSNARAAGNSRVATVRPRTLANGPFNSLLNSLSTDNTTAQSETSVAVCDNLAAKFCPGITVMVAYNDAIASEGVGYSYAFDGGSRWTDGGTLPYYKDSSGLGTNTGDPGVTVDRNGVFYFSEIAFTHSGDEFVGMSTCKYLSTTGGMACSRPQAVTPTAPKCQFYFLNLVGPYDKPAITYDPVRNRVYVTWTDYTFGSNCSAMSVLPQFRYYDVGTKTWSSIYTENLAGSGDGTAPVTVGGKLYVFFEYSSGGSDKIEYFTFNNSSVSGPKIVYPVVPIGDTSGASCTQLPFPAQNNLHTQAWDNGHAARTTDYPSVAADSQGDIDVTWNGVPSAGQGTGPSVVYVATLPSGGGKPYVQALPDHVDSAGQLLTQWQPSIAYAGGPNGLAVGYFQSVQLPGGSYQIERDQVTATASATPSFGTAQMISSVSWSPPPSNTPNNGPCNEGDYSSSASTPTANVVWSYWGDSRNLDPNGNPEQDVYGLYTNVP